jgi:hypothetical protein
MAGKESFAITPDDALETLKALNLVTRIEILGAVPSGDIEPGKDLGKQDYINVIVDPREAQKYITDNFNEGVAGSRTVSGITTREIQGTFTKDGESREIYFELINREQTLAYLKLTYRPGNSKPKPGFLERWFG